MKTNHALCGLISGLLLLAAGTAQTHAGLLVPAAPNASLYVSNYSGNSIEKYSSTGTDLGVFANTALNGPSGLAFDQSGNLYAANLAGNSIEKFSSTGTDLGIFANTGLNVPFGLAFDSTGNLYAANSGSSTIEKFSPTGTDLGIFANTGLSEPLFLAFDNAAVPEPGTALFGMACVGVAALRRRRRA